MARENLRRNDKKQRRSLSEGMSTKEEEGETDDQDGEVESVKHKVE